jgi:hypothetical protein
MEPGISPPADDCPEGQDSRAALPSRSPAANSKMERRMAALFLLALALIAWQALRTKPLGPPALEIVTKKGEQLLPVGVPSWSPPPHLSSELPERLAFLKEHSVLWPGVGDAKDLFGCQVFVRLSSQHWCRRSASSVQVQRWLGARSAGGAAKAWQLLYFPAASFLDDDDGDGDPLDAGELRETGPGAEVEVFCGSAAPRVGGRL